MKFIKSIIKNFKILFRIKTTLLAVVLGPLFIILLIGLAFNSSSGISISVGYTAMDNSALTQDFVHSLHDKGYQVQQFATKQDCVKTLKAGLTHMCLVFPKDFSVENNKTNELVFVVDKSRTNIVYEIIDSVSSDVGLQADQLSKSLTEQLTSTLTSTSNTIDQDLASLVLIKNKVAGVSTDANDISDNLGNMDLDMGNINSDFTSQSENLNEYTKEIRDEVISATDDIIANSSGSVAQTAQDLQDFAIEKYNSSEDYLNAVKVQINATKNGLDALEEKLATAKTLTTENQANIQSLRTKLSEISADIDSVKRDLEGITNRINSIKVTSTDQIVNPITTKVETINTKANKLAILFPYALMLVMMFIGLFLASTLVVIEKRSKASFRIFTTPTRDEFYLFSTFVTSFIIVIVEIALILLLSKFFFVDFISANLLVNSLLILISTATFVLIGMTIGYIFSTPQATNMASLSLGAIFLFLSNMVLPMESLSHQFQFIAQFNPYVLASESLRRSILFLTPLNELSFPFLVMGIYVVGLLILIVFVQKMVKNIYFTKKPLSLAKQIDSIKTLQIHEKNVYNEKEFIIAINRLSETEYEDVVRGQEKEIQHFLKKQLRYGRIARKFTKMTKKELLDAFAKQYEKRYKDLKKHEEELTKQLRDSKKKATKK